MEGHTPRGHEASRTTEHHPHPPVGPGVFSRNHLECFHSCHFYRGPFQPLLSPALCPGVWAFAESISIPFVGWTLLMSANGRHLAWIRGERKDQRRLCFFPVWMSSLQQGLCAFLTSDAPRVFLFTRVFPFPWSQYLQITPASDTTVFFLCPLGDHGFPQLLSLFTLYYPLMCPDCCCLDTRACQTLL